MTAAGRRWYVVQTQPHAELRAAQHLQRQGFATYLPRCLKRRRHARRTETIAAPLFPRYLFVAADLSAQRWRAIRSTIGVSRLVCNGDAPAPLADAVVERLRAQEQSGFVRLPAAPAFARGDAVRVIDGAFATCFGLFDGMRDDERVTVLLDLLGRKVRVAIEREMIAAA
jgi:transcriptional antiterminator RfaH